MGAIVQAKAIFLPIAPVPKPRMTQADKFHARDVTTRYWLFKDELRSLWGDREFPTPCHLIFFLTTPSSWSKKKKERAIGTYHRQRPDIDNLVKGVLDAIFDEDGHICDIRSSKYWSDHDGILVKPIQSESPEAILSIIEKTRPTPCYQM